MDAINYAKNYVLEHANTKNLPYKLSTAKNTESNLTITISDKANKPLGEIIIEKAIGSAFQKATQMSNRQLHNCAVLHSPMISDSDEHASLLEPLCYFAMRQARIWKCQNIIYIHTENDPLSEKIISTLHLAPISYCPSTTINNQKNFIFAQRIKYAIHHTFEQSDASYKPFIQSEFINEILDIFENWVNELFTQSWFNAVFSRTISKEQYITSLYNLHQFVKHTTRLAARCVACSDNRELRNHYINHLKGEINHELIIESDLERLGADVNYLINAHVAHAATSEFITIQESIIGFKQDPVLMLACPFVAEGMTANISYRFVEDLHATIETWGVDKPESVSRFLTSHMKTDGGVDGHWLRVVVMTHKFIQNELQHQHFINTMRLAMSGYAHGLNANIDDLELWRPTADVNAADAVIA